jgi:cephalosporin-C deacetylase-like acetyl esterase
MLLNSLKVVADDVRHAVASALEAYPALDSDRVTLIGKGFGGNIGLNAFKITFKKPIQGHIDVFFSSSNLLECQTVRAVP